MTTDTADFPCTTSERETERRSKTSIVLSSPTSGMLWCVGWLFTIGFAELGFWKGLLALILWPYFLGELVR